jgi:hypothetical protein
LSRAIILVLQVRCTIYCGLWPLDNTSCYLSNMVSEQGLGFCTSQLRCCKSRSEFRAAVYQNFFSNPRRYQRLILCAMVALRCLLFVLVCTFAELPQIDLLGPGRSATPDGLDAPTRPATSQPSSRLLSRSIGSRIPGRCRPSLPRGCPPDRGRPPDPGSLPDTVSAPTGAISSLQSMFPLLPHVVPDRASQDVFHLCARGHMDCCFRVFVRGHLLFVGWSADKMVMGC